MLPETSRKTHKSTRFPYIPNAVSDHDGLQHKMPYNSVFVDGFVSLCWTGYKQSLGR